MLTEPLACSMHAVARADLAGDETVAVIGVGAIGLLTIVALRDRHPQATIVAVAKHRGQEQEARRDGRRRGLCDRASCTSAAVA